MATNTTNYSLLKPTVSGDNGVWGGYINQDLDSLDSLLGGGTPIVGIDINSGSIDNAPIGAATPNTGAFTSVAVDNITVDGQQITSTNTNGNIQLFANGTGYVELYGNTNAGAIRFNCESNSHGITIKGAPHSAGATYSLELPNALGSSGQVLSLSDGAGKLAFTTIAATTLSDLGITASASEINKLEPKTQSLSIEPYTNIAIEELQLSVRAYNCLKKAHINTVGDLLQYSPEKLQELKNFGRKSADEVFSTLKNKLGIILK